MGDTLLGGEKSGTPLETRKGTTEFAGLLQQLLRGTGGAGIKNITDPFSRLISDALMASFGGENQDAVIRSLLADPADATRGLFASMAPFEAEETERQAAGVRNIFGTAGGRFSRNVSQAEASVRSRTASEFGRNRENALLTANSQRAGLVQGLIQAGLQRAQLAMSPLQLLAQFFQPGAPQQSGGLLPGLLSAGVNLYGIKQLNSGSPTSGGPKTLPNVGKTGGSPGGFSLPGQYPG